MAANDNEHIKRMIISNFDSSPEKYEEFENECGLFSHLARDLARICNISEGMRICDMGCGTGASTMILGELVGEHGMVMGLDFSREMLNTAREKTGAMGIRNIEYLLGDACNMDGMLAGHLEGGFDAILYNASIFLMPDTKAALTTAYNLLDKGGVVGMTYLDGVFKNENMIGNDIFTEAKKAGAGHAPYGRKLMEPGQLSEIMKGIGFRSLGTGKIVRKMKLEKMRKFYSIPAQSAGLYPKTPYEERLELLDHLISDLRRDGIRSVDQVWGWASGLK